MPISPRPGSSLGVAPQVVMVELLLGGDLEARDMHALGVHAAHDMAYGAVFASRIHGLQTEHQPVGVLGGQPLLVLSQQLDALP